MIFSFVSESVWLFSAVLMTLSQMLLLIKMTLNECKKGHLESHKTHCYYLSWWDITTASMQWMKLGCRDLSHSSNASKRTLCFWNELPVQKKLLIKTLPIVAAMLLPLKWGLYQFLFKLLLLKFLLLLGFCGGQSISDVKCWRGADIILCCLKTMLLQIENIVIRVVSLITVTKLSRHLP